VLYGQSLGTAMALPAAADGIGDAIVLEASFTSFLDLVAAQYPLENLGDLATQDQDSRPTPAIFASLFLSSKKIGKIAPIVLSREIFATAGHPKNSSSKLPVKATGLFRGQACKARFAPS